MKISQIAFSALATGIIAASASVQAQSATESEKSDVAAARSTNEVGISSHDGITMSGSDVIVTRNGLSEKLTKPLELENGLRVHPDGVINTRDGRKLSLRPLQILTFDGRFLNFPVHESVSSNSTTRTETRVDPAEAPKEIKKTNEDQPLTKEAAEEVARQEAARRARAANEAEKSGAGSQK
jgi:hypothetical protein